MEIYYVEDDRDIAEGVKTYLEARDFHITILESVADAKQALLKRQPAMIIIDWNLPDGSGDILCGWIRRCFGENLPVLFLTRIQAILRRVGNIERRELYCDNIRLDTEKIAAYREEEEVSLSQPEYQLLRYLLEHKGKTVTREKLLAEVWDVNGNYVNDNTLTVTMKRLREKLGNPACIRTIRSFGYRMEDTL